MVILKVSTRESTLELFTLADKSPNFSKTDERFRVVFKYLVKEEAYFLCNATLLHESVSLTFRETLLVI